MHILEAAAAQQQIKDILRMILNYPRLELTDEKLVNRYPCHKNTNPSAKRNVAHRIVQHKNLCSRIDCLVDLCQFSGLSASELITEADSAIIGDVEEKIMCLRAKSVQQ